MLIFSKSSNIIQKIFFICMKLLAFTELCESIPVATKCSQVKLVISYKIYFNCTKLLALLNYVIRLPLQPSVVK